MTAERLPWIAADPASRRLFELAQKVAPAPTTLLISGESGTGKDYLARLVHELGPRRDAPFLKIDCASLPPQLVESELFGHERGAFTGAVDRKLGRFELGGAGTIVLDEIAALLPGVQGKLLRVLQERTFERLGGTETIHIDARLIALTNVDLPAAVAARPALAQASGYAVTIALTDVAAPWNAGTWRIACSDRAMTAERTNTAPQLEMDICALAPIYNGYTKPIDAARVGSITVVDAGALDELESLLATSFTPYCPDDF